MREDLQHSVVRFTFTIAAVCLTSLAAPAAIADWEQTCKLTAADAAAGDLFGYRVAVSGDFAVIGSPADDNAGIDFGSVYIFDVTTGQQLRKLVALDAATEDAFGFSVAISGDIAVVGARADDDAGSSSGSAYVFDVTTGQQLQKLTASDAAPEDAFGVSVAVDGSVAVVGAYFDDDAGASSGSAYVFDITTGQQLHKLTASDAAKKDEFGVSVALSGNIAVIGAWRDDDAGSTTGSAYVFDVATGQQLHKLIADYAAAFDWFGVSVSLSGSTAVIGACTDDDAGEKSGSAYVFDAVTGQQLRKLTAADGAAGDYLGWSVAISGAVAAVGAPYDDDGGNASGSAYIFDVTTGQEICKLIAADAAVADWFGFSVGISGSAAVAGSFYDDDDGESSGSAYLFKQVNPCPSDINGDGVVDVLDLLQLVADWGPCE